jgi:hypothetical protein
MDFDWLPIRQQLLGQPKFVALKHLRNVGFHSSTQPTLININPTNHNSGNRKLNQQIP